jgi:GNAT superfamily N-acetyltransferase
VVDDVSATHDISVVDDEDADDGRLGRHAVRQESVRTYLTLGPRSTGSGLSVGYDVSAPPEVRPLSRDELDVVLSWAADEGWNPGLADADALWAADPGGLWGVEIDGVLVGSGATVSRGTRDAVVGMLLVQREHRGMGVGSVVFPFLVDGALSRLEPGATLELHAPAAHQDFCERFGFRAVGRTARMTGVGAMRRRGPYSGQLRALATLPLDKIVEYDAAHVGAERPDLLRAWISPRNGHGIAAYEEGRLIGMAVMRPCVTGYRVGPLYADSPDIADEILVALSGTVVGQPITIDVMTENPDALGLAAHHSLSETSSLVRMRMGEATEPRLGSVYAVTTVEFG